ncbi:MAG: polysaccharide biosynthesis tyrosine autokinase [Pseudomonadota bacterium]
MRSLAHNTRQDLRSTAAGSDNRGGGPYSTFGAQDERGRFRKLIQSHWRIVKRWRWIAFIIATAVIASSAIYALLQPPSYTATARLQINETSSQVVKGGAVLSERVRNVYDLRTMHQVLTSRSIAKRVASSMKLADDKSFAQPWSNSLLGLPMQRLVQRFVQRVWGQTQSDTATARATRERIVLDTVMARQRVRAVPGSRLVDVTYTDTVPDRAARIANAYARAFIDATLDKKLGAKSYAKVYLEDQLKTLQLKLKTSEQSLFAFAQREGIFIGKDQVSATKSNLTMAASALNDVVSRRVKAEQKWRQVSAAGAINTPEFLTNTVIDGLREQRNKLKIEYRGKLEIFKPSYPAMVRIKDKLAEVDRQLAAEVATIRNALKSGFESLVQQEKDLQTRVGKLRDEALELQKRRTQHGILKREVDSNRELYNDLLRQHKEVTISAGVGTSNVSIIDPATKPLQASSPSLIRTLFLAVALGLGLGIGSAYLLDMLDDRIYVPDDIEERVGMSVLGAIPEVRGNAIENDLLDPSSTSSEAYRSLATALRFSLPDGLPRVLCVSSSSSNEGKSTSALALARQFARMDLKVLLIDADLRDATLHTKFGLPNNAGLAGYLSGAHRPSQIVCATDLPSLILIPGGPLPTNPSELLASPRLRTLLADGAEVFDIVIVDAPPTLGLADMLLLADVSTFTLLVASAGRTQARMLRSAIQRLQLPNQSPIAVALTRTSGAVSHSPDRSVRRNATGPRSRANNSKPVMPPSKTRPSVMAFKGAA